ncbi:unnamed protein product [Brassicogethes aeneus]|uniref:Uncharacterized protein n=1 Tax=Brassicogethes aeneus TaxID=1431903 RepID=A0A9P0ARV3_BRAAE|nr:unnamed protein product [Brassicogethes aeneus]
MKHVQSEDVTTDCDEGCTQVILKDDEGNLEVAKLAELCGREGILDPNKASVNITESEDVIVGPVTQFYAPVTIYQNVNGEINGTEKNEVNKKLPEPITESSLTIVNEDTPKLINKDKSKKIKHLIIIIAAVIISIIIVAVTIAMILKKSKHPNYKPPTDLDDQFLLYKADWGGKAATDDIPINKKPVQYVIISHTVSPMCNNVQACSSRVRNIQSQHQNGPFPDIGYNFLVGNDGHAYEGRGWNHKNFHMYDSVAICEIGDFTTDIFTNVMIESTKRLIDLGITLNKISTHYKLIGQNQTTTSESPGSNVYKVIKTWPHFYAGRVSS